LRFFFLLFLWIVREDSQPRRNTHDIGDLSAGECGRGRLILFCPEFDRLRHEVLLLFIRGASANWRTRQRRIDSL
jgi:hypothetical protein